MHGSAPQFRSNVNVDEGGTNRENDVDNADKRDSTHPLVPAVWIVTSDHLNSLCVRKCVITACENRELVS